MIDEEVIKSFQYINIDLLKYILEESGYDFNITNNDILLGDEYPNGIIDNIIQNNNNFDSLQLDGMALNPIKISNTQALLNGKTLIAILVNEFGLTNFQAAAFAGVFMAESGLNPGAFCKQEKTGEGVPGQSKATAQLLARTRGYGAGIAQWTFQERKSKAVASLNKLTGKKYNWQALETIPFDDQVRMVGAELSSKFINMIKSCNTVEQAVDLVLRGYENGGGGSGALASQVAMDKYTWAGGYAGLMKTRVGFAKTFLT